MCSWCAPVCPKVMGVLVAPKPRNRFGAQNEKGGWPWADVPGRKTGLNLAYRYPKGLAYLCASKAKRCPSGSVPGWVTCRY